MRALTRPSIFTRTATATVALALALPGAISAQTLVGPEQAHVEALEAALAQPNLQADLDAEVEAGLTGDMLLCEDETPQPCAEDSKLVTPEGLVVHLSTDGLIYLADAEDQTVDATAAGKEAGSTPGAEVAADMTDAANTAGDTVAEVGAGVAGAVGSAVDAVAEPAADVAATAEAETTEAVNAASDAVSDAGAATAEAAEAAKEKAAEVADDVAAPAKTEAPATEAPQNLPAAAESATADEERALEEALKAEMAAPATQTEAPAKPVAKPAPEVAAESAPQPVAKPETDAAAAPVAKSAAEEPTADPAAVEVQDDETAREAAAETAPSMLAALNGDDTSTEAPEVVSETVTEEAARSSSEDFEDDLSAAIRDTREKIEGELGGNATEVPGNAQIEPAQSAEAKPKKDSGDRNRDIVRGLALAGIGAVIANQLVKNNDDRQVALATDDRVVVTRADGSQEVIKDEMSLLRQPGAQVQTQTFDDGSSRTVVLREDGSQVITIRDANLRVLQRSLVSPDGVKTALIDDTAGAEPVDLSKLPKNLAPAQPDISVTDERALRLALARDSATDRGYSLNQIRNIAQVRALASPIDIDAITFPTGSAAITPDQARSLSALGRVIAQAIANNPAEIFLIEGHTDATGDAAYNLALSDRRAESVALALTEYFDVPPENLVVQGYGERFLKVQTQASDGRNRRASVRRITQLLARN